MLDDLDRLLDGALSGWIAKDEPAQPVTIKPPSRVIKATTADETHVAIAPKAAPQSTRTIGEALALRATHWTDAHAIGEVARLVVVGDTAELCAPAQCDDSERAATAPLPRPAMPERSGLLVPAVEAKDQPSGDEANGDPHGLTRRRKEWRQAYRTVRYTMKPGKATQTRCRFSGC